jgi:hypothetical protein
MRGYENFFFDFGCFGGVERSGFGGCDDHGERGAQLLWQLREGHHEGD